MVKQYYNRANPKDRRYKRKVRNSTLRFVIRTAGELSGEKQEKLWDREGKKWLAQGLGIKVQSINHWKRIPRERVMMVHVLTKIPLHVLAPDLFPKP